MSLFKAREWWSTVSGYEEFHSTGSLLIAPVTNNDKSKNVIFVGSLSGMLRAYAPSSGGFSPDHLLLEMQLSSPVIKVEQADINGYIHAYNRFITLYPLVKGQ
jgi:Bardet-Biedl syndrome 9 protein